MVLHKQYVTPFAPMNTLHALLTRTNAGIALRALGENAELIGVYGLTAVALDGWPFFDESLLDSVRASAPWSLGVLAVFARSAEALPPRPSSQ